MKTITYSIILIASAASILSLTYSDHKSVKLTQKTLNENYAYVPSGDFEKDGKKISVQSYLISKQEVTNGEYRTFLLDLKERGELQKWAIAAVDSSGWSTKNNLNMKYQDYYHSHPAYADYPVVNVSKEGAILYCEWLSNKVNQNLGQTSKLAFRLPTKAEWLKAAKGNLEIPVYAWGGPYLRNSKGLVLCNFMNLGSEAIARNNEGELYIETRSQGNYADYNADIIAPAKSYWPNGFGLYNMNGNVAEMIADEEVVVGGSWADPGFDVRNESEKAYTGANRTVGFRVVATVAISENEWIKIPKK